MIIKNKKNDEIEKNWKKLKKKSLDLEISTRKIWWNSWKSDETFFCHLNYLSKLIFLYKYLMPENHQWDENNETTNT